VTSTFGMPRAASRQVVVLAASLKTPKSVAACRSPVLSSRTSSVIGRSARSRLMFVHVVVFETGS
jgi:hypothetical protein